MRQLFFTLFYLYTLILTAQPFRYRSFDNLNGLTHGIVIKSIAQDSTDMIWFASNEALYSWDGYDVVNYDINESIMAGAVNCILVDHNRVMMGCEKGLLCFDLSSRQFSRVEWSSGIQVRCMAHDEDHLYAGTDQGIFCNGELMRIPVTMVHSLCLNRDKLYIGCMPSLYCYSFRNKRLTLLNENMFVVESVLESKNDNILWVGAVPRLYKLDRVTHKVLDSRVFPVIKTMCMDRDDNLLIGTDNGLFVMDRRQNLIHVNHDARNRVESIAGDIIWCVFQDRHGNIWIGTENGVSLREYEEVLTSYTLPELTGMNGGNMIDKICMDRNGRLWCGGSHGLICIKGIGTDHQSSRWYKMNDPQYPLRHNRVRGVYEDSRLRMWIAIDGAVMFLDDGKDDFMELTIQEDEHNWVYEIKELDNHDILMTTYNATYVVNGEVPIRDGRFVNVKSVKKKEIVNSRQTTAITPNGDVWTITKDGLMVEVQSTHTIRDISTQDKYLSICYDARGDLIWMGGSDRVACVSVDGFSADIDVNVPVITRAEVVGEGPVDYQALVDRHLELEYTQNDLMFYFSDFNYGSQKVSCYSFYVDNLHSSWIPLRPGSNSLLLSSLAPGTYTLYISASNILEKDERSSVTFTISPPWYQSKVAWTIYAVLFVSLIVAVVMYWRQRQITLFERRKHQNIYVRAKRKEERLMSDKAQLEKQLKLQIKSRHEDEQELSQDENLLLRITKLIEDNMDDPELSVDKLSQMSGISTKQLYRKTKQLTDMTTVAYIRHLRLKKAAILLCDRHFSISEVMYRVGFSNASYFTRCFLEEYKQTPSDYKAEMRKDE